MIKASYVKKFLEYFLGINFATYYYIVKVPSISPTPHPFLGVS